MLTMRKFEIEFSVVKYNISKYTHTHRKKNRRKKKEILPIQMCIVQSKDKSSGSQGFVQDNSVGKAL